MRLTAVLAALAALAAATARDAVLQDAQQAAINLNTLDYRQVQDGLRLWEQSATGPLFDEVRANRVTYAHVITDTKTATTAASASSAPPAASRRSATSRPLRGGRAGRTASQRGGGARRRGTPRALAVADRGTGGTDRRRAGRPGHGGMAARRNRCAARISGDQQPRVARPRPHRRGVRAGPGCGGTCVLLRLRPARRQRMRRRRDHRPFASDYHRQFAGYVSWRPGSRPWWWRPCPRWPSSCSMAIGRSWWCLSTSKPTGAARRSHCLRPEGCGLPCSGPPAAGRSPTCNHSEHNGWEAVSDRSSSMNGPFLR